MAWGFGTLITGRVSEHQSPECRGHGVRSAIRSGNLRFSTEKDRRGRRSVCWKKSACLPVFRNEASIILGCLASIAYLLSHSFKNCECVKEEFQYSMTSHDWMPTWPKPKPRENAHLAENICGNEAIPCTHVFYNTVMSGICLEHERALVYAPSGKARGIESVV